MNIERTHDFLQKCFDITYDQHCVFLIELLFLLFICINIRFNIVRVDEWTHILVLVNACGVWFQMLIDEHKIVIKYWLHKLILAKLLKHHILYDSLHMLIIKWLKEERSKHVVFKGIRTLFENENFINQSIIDHNYWETLRIC
jgi:hypothetical protein